MTSLELFFLELGFIPTHFTYDIAILDRLTTNSHVKSTMLFLWQHNIILRHSIAIKPLRENDLCIMSTLFDLQIPGNELLACNHCRLYLRACMLSELSSGDGTLLLDDAWLGIPLLIDHKDKSWPAYPKPSLAMWQIWRKWISKAFLIRGRRLRQPLGSWLSWDEHWPWYTSSAGNLYSYTNGQWMEHTPVLLRKRLPTYQAEGAVCPPPSSIMRATTYQKGERIVCTGSGHILTNPIRTYATFYDFLKAQPDLDWCTHNLVVAQDCGVITSAIQSGLQGSIMAVSDRSFKDSHGTSSMDHRDSRSLAVYIGTSSVPRLHQ
jgi:hypothetical protein